MNHVRIRTVVRGTLLLGALTGFALPARAQSAEAPRVGVGLSTTKGGGIGVNGGVLYPVKDLGVRTIGVVGAGSFLHFDGYKVVSFGGGLRWTRRLDTVASGKNFRIYGQGLFGIAHDSGGGFSETDKGFTVGAGAGFTVNPAFDGFIEVDIARVLPSNFDGFNSLVFTFGLSKAMAKR